MRRKFKRRFAMPRLEVCESRSLLSALIALIDYGVDLNNPNDNKYYDLADAFNAYTSQLASGAGNQVVQDTASHGADVTDATVQGIVDTSSQPGVSLPDVKILPIKYSDSSNNASYEAIIRGIYYAVDHRASVVNLSIGQPQSDPFAYIPTSDPWVHDPNVAGPIYYLSDAILYAESKGVVVVTAAGNNGYQNQPGGVDIDGSSQSWPIYPAYTHTPNMLVAASVDATGTLYPGSNWGGQHVDLGAFWDPSNSKWETSFATGYVSGVTGTIAALRHDLFGDALAAFIKATVQTQPQLTGKLTTNGEISPENVVNAIFTPTITAAASASSHPITSPTTTLSVRATDADDGSGLTYTWSVAATPGAPVPTFSANGTGNAQDTVVTFSQAGTYIFTVTVSDGPHRTATSSVSVTVEPSLRSIAISPAAATVADGNSQAFLALARDQFGAVMSPQPAYSWSVQSGGVGGTIDSTGKYTAPSSGAGSDTIKVTSGEASQVVTVNVTSSSPPPPSEPVALILNPVSVASSSNYGTNPPWFTTNEIGLSAPMQTGDPIPASYPLKDNNFYHNFVTNGNGSAGTESVTYQLVYLDHAPLNIIGFHWWAYSADAPQRSIKSANVSSSADGVHFSDPVPMTFYEGSDALDSGRDFAFSASGIRFVRFSNLMNYGPDSPGGLSFDGLGAIRFFATPTQAIAIASGSATGAASFQPDTSVVGGAAYETTSPIDTSGVSDPAPQSVYQTERYGNFTYSLSNLVPGGSSTIRLHFAEIFWNTAGQRLFNVAINGDQVLTNFDVFAAAGGKNRAIIKQFNATADSRGTITIVFSSLKDNAKVSGIEIMPASLSQT